MKKQRNLLLIVNLAALLTGCNLAAENEPTKSSVKVSWVNDNGEVLEIDEDVAIGTVPIYNGSLPTKASDDDYRYVFTGWSPEVKEVVEDTIYIAKFKELDNKFTINWIVEGTIVLEESYHYGEVPSYKGETPKKADDDYYTYEFNGWSPEITEVTEDTNYVAIFTQKKLPLPFDLEPYEMPVFNIETENGAPIESKEVYVPAELGIYNAGNANKTGLTLGIRGRGNYSWSGTEKKSYRIKFDSKYQPLAQGKGPCKSWTLLAVHCDKSLLRTDAAFSFASKLENIPFVSSSSFVELMLNGEYQGVYELCDQIQVNKYRVNIDDSGEEDDIGYLVELDKNASEDVVRLSSGLTFEVKSDYQNESQLTFIQNYLNQCENALKNGNFDTISALIDIPSAVDAYLVEEFMKNLDVGRGSFYYTKPKGDKLYFGPVWDFDLCAGNADSDYSDSTFTSYKYTYVGNEAYDYYMQQHTRFIYLRRCDWFNELVKNRWSEVNDYAFETVEHVENMKNTYINSFKRNFTRWKIFNQKINREPDAIMRIKSFVGQVQYFEQWLENRANWLTGYYDGANSDVS